VLEEEEPPKVLPLTDKNIISPGTTFSALLSKHLQYFIRFKLNTDPAY
jgi:5'-3' exonuclease